MVTEEVARSIEEVLRAERCVQDCTRDLTTARRNRDDALRRQQVMQEEKVRIERSLGLLPGGQATLGGVARQSTIVPGKRALQERLRELNRVLNARP